MEAYLTALDQIESELTRLWEAQKATYKTRASLFNLIFFTELDERTPYVRTLVKRIIEKFPARVLFITRLQAGNQLNAQVSVVPSSPENPEFACDLIEIEMTASEEVRAAFLLLPHLLPDLPITTIWAHPPSLENRFFQELLSLSDKMIFDSGLITDVSPYAAQLLQVHKKCDIGDLTWARIENWRRLLITTFYSTERLKQLSNAKQLQIFYNAEAKPTYLRADLQAFFLQGWLASQLGWKKGDVEILLTPEAQLELPHGCILSIDISTKDNSHFSFGRDLHQPHQISMRFSTLEKCDIPLKYFFEKAESGRSLVQEIGHPGTSPHFLNLLRSCTTN